MRGLEKNCTRWRKQTDTQTDGHGDSMTNSAQWGRVGENYSVGSIIFQQDVVKMQLKLWRLASYKMDVEI